MVDPRHQKLAQVLVHYSLALKPGDKFILSGPAFAEPLIREVYREAVQAGAHVTTNITLEDLREIFYQEANDEQLTYISEVEQLENEYSDAELTIWGSQNTKSLSGVDPRRIAKRREA